MTRWLSALVLLLAVLCAPLVSHAIPQKSTNLQPGYVGIGDVNGKIIDIAGYTTAVFQVSGTFSATVTPQVSLNGTRYDTLTCFQLDGSTAVTSFTTQGTWRCNITGNSLLKASISSYVSGTVIIDVSVTDGGSPVTSTGSGGAGGTTQILDGVGGTNKAQVNGSNQLSVVCANCSGSGVSQVDTTNFVAATTVFVPTGGVFDDTPIADCTTGKACGSRITAKRGVHANLRNASGTEIGTAGNPVRVDPTGVTTQPVSVSGTVAVSGTVTANQGGAPWTMRVQDGAAGTLATVTAGNALKIDGSAVTQPVSGTVTANAGTNLNTSALLLDATFTGRFPAAYVDADAIANQTTTAIHGQLYGYNGTTWDRLQVDASKFLKVNCVTGCSASAGFVDNSAFTFGTTTITPIGGVLDDVATNAATENSAAIARITAQKGLHTNLRNNAGTEVGTAGAPLRIDPTGTSSQPVVGTGTAGTPAGNILTVQGVTSMTKLLVTPDSVALPANQSVNVAQIAGATTTTLAAGEQKVGVEGLAASGAAKSGNPVQIGGVFNTTQPTVTTGQAVEAQATARGGLIVATGVDAFTVAGTVTTSPPANASTNIAQINGITPLMGNGITGTGSQRVTIASDNTAFAVNNTQQGTASQNVAQFGGNAVATGTGVGGVGIPRVTVSNDSNVLATQSGIWNIGTMTALTGITNALPTGANTIGAVTGTAADNSANSSLKLPVLPARANTSAPTWTDGLQVPLSVDTAGNLRVNSTGGGAADGTTFTENSTTFSATGGYYQSGSIGPVVSGKEYAAQLTQGRGLHNNLRDNSGAEVGTASNPLNVTLNKTLLATKPGPNLTQLFPQPSFLVGSMGQRVGMVGDALKVAATPSQDVCATSRKTDVAISQTATTRLVLGVPGQTIYVCFIRLVASVAEIVSEWEGTGTNCGTGTVAHSGSATVANGQSLAANGGFSSGDGAATVTTIGPGVDYCLAQSGANRVSGKVSYVYGP